MTAQRTTAGVLYFSLFLFLLADHAIACVAIAGKGAVGIQRETAVILWDAPNKTEHFIRQAVLNSPNAEHANFVGR